MNSNSMFSKIGTIRCIKFKLRNVGLDKDGKHPYFFKRARVNNRGYHKSILLPKIRKTNSSK